VILGANVRNLTSEESRRVGSNHGVMVMSVVSGSPAFMADVLAGDRLKSMAGTPVPNKSAYTQLLKHLEGKCVALDLVRDGSPLSITVQLNR
jgi:S1-C subfamily serine protease